MNGDDVLVLELGAELALAAEEVAFVVAARTAVAGPQDLDRDELAGDLVRGAEHAGEGAGAHAVLDLVVAVEEAGAEILDQAVELVVGQQPAADEGLLEGFDFDVARAVLAPDDLEVLIGQRTDVDGALGELLCRESGSHRAQSQTPCSWESDDRLRPPRVGTTRRRPSPCACGLANPSPSRRTGNAIAGFMAIGAPSSPISYSSNFNRYSSRSRRVASRSNIRYFMSSRSWLRAS